MRIWNIKKMNITQSKLNPRNLCGKTNGIIKRREN